MVCYFVFVISSCFCTLARIFCMRQRTVCTCPSCLPFYRTLLRKPHTYRHTFDTFALRIRFPCTSSLRPFCTCLHSPCTSSCTFPSCPSFPCLSLSCILYNKPRRPLRTHCSFQYRFGIVGFLTLKK